MEDGYRELPLRFKRRKRRGRQSQTVCFTFPMRVSENERESKNGRGKTIWRTDVVDSSPHLACPDWSVPRRSDANAAGARQWNFLVRQEATVDDAVRVFWWPVKWILKHVSIPPAKKPSSIINNKIWNVIDEYGPLR